MVPYGVSACAGPFIIPFCRAVYLTARDATPPTTAIAILEQILKGQFETTIETGGQTLISTSDEGQSVSFAIPPGLDARSLMTLASDAIEWFEDQEDPSNPDFSRDCQPRIQASFSTAPT